MMGRLLRYLVLHAVVPAMFLTAGWYSGAKFGAPAFYLNSVDALAARANAVIAPLLGRTGDAASTAARQASDYASGTVAEMLSGKHELAPTADEAEPSAPQTQPTSSGGVAICGGMRVSNAPHASASGVLAPAGASVSYNGSSLLLMPATNACFSSGYGSRNGKTHRGVDYYAKTGGDVLAAGDGVIVEALSRSDYGNMIVIDHGGGVYTRYAHLARFAGGVRKGASVRKGQTLGPIGKSGQAGVVHLHYELLTGDINTQAGSFGLRPIDLFSL